MNTEYAYKTVLKKQFAAVDIRSIGQGIDSTVAPVNVVTEHIKKVPGICSEIDLLI